MIDPGRKRILYRAPLSDDWECSGGVLPILPCRTSSRTTARPGPDARIGIAMRKSRPSLPLLSSSSSRCARPGGSCFRRSTDISRSASAHLLRAESEPLRTIAFVANAPEVSRPLIGDIGITVRPQPATGHLRHRQGSRVPDRHRTFPINGKRTSPSTRCRRSARRHPRSSLTGESSLLENRPYDPEAGLAPACVCVYLGEGPHNLTSLDSQTAQHPARERSS